MCGLSARARASRGLLHLTIGRPLPAWLGVSSYLWCQARFNGGGLEKESFIPEHFGEHFGSTRAWEPTIPPKHYAIAQL